MNDNAQKLLLVYKSTPYIYNLYMFLKSHGITYILISWNICDDVWYIPIMYNKSISDEFDFESQYVTRDSLHATQYKRYDFACCVPACMIISKDNAIVNDDSDILPIIELFIMKCVDTDIHKRQKIQHDAIIKYMQHTIKSPLSQILQSVNLMHITNSASKKSVKNVSEEYELLKTLNSQYIEKIHKNVMTLSNGIFDIIDLALLESGKFTINKHTFNLHELIESTIKIISVNGNQQLSINYYIEPNVPITIYSDSKRIKQIIMALLDNAVKFTTKGEISLHVYATVVSLDKEDGLINKTTSNTFDIMQEHTQYSVSFLVYDTGCGMDSKTIAALFKPIMGIIPKQQQCKRGDLMNELKEKHYGLSLRMSYLLAKHLHGSLTLQYSDVDKGSCFNFSLVAYEDEPNVINTQTIKYLKGRKVLIIDHTAEKNTICCMLDKYQLIYNVANEYDDLKILIPNKEYDIIFMNVDFPFTRSHDITLKEFIMKVKYVQRAIFIALINKNNTANEQELIVFDDVIYIPSEFETYKSRIVMHLLTMPIAQAPI